MSVGLAATADAGISAIEEQTEIRVYEVFGMDCPGCHGGLEKLVKKIPAVQSVEANYLEQLLTVVVVSGENLDDAVIHDAIERANFSAGKRVK